MFAAYVLTITGGQDIQKRNGRRHPMPSRRRADNGLDSAVILES